MTLRVLLRGLDTTDLGVTRGELVLEILLKMYREVPFRSGPTGLGNRIVNTMDTSRD